MLYHYNQSSQNILFKTEDKSHFISKYLFWTSDPANTYQSPCRASLIMLQKISIPDDELILEQSRARLYDLRWSVVFITTKNILHVVENSRIYLATDRWISKGSNRQTRRPLNVQAAFGAKYKLLDRARLRPPMLSPSSNKSMTLKRKVSLPNPRVRTR